MREQFEKLPEIVQGLRHCHYDESTNIYHADAAHVEEFEWHTQFVNGAWYAYQEQEERFNKRRPELDSDTCSDIRNHISPPTKVIDR